MLYDLFICHASEDKESFVRPLANWLKKENVEVWYDEFSLKLGDSIRRSIDKGLSQSRFGMVVLSKSFFEKNWPQYELDGLAEREMSGNDKVILPIWHDVTQKEVRSYSPSLAGRKAVSSCIGIENVGSEILSVIHPQESPLIIARDFLLKFGVTPPVITDKYWLEVVEASNRSPGMGAVIPEESIWGRWSFPLPPRDNALDWGERLAWTAMQLKWVKEAEEIPITILTHPTKVISFIKNTPGLFEICTIYPELVAEYAPQLTIPTMGHELEEIFEKEYQKSLDAHLKQRQGNSISCTALTTNHKSPACDEEWALRHPSLVDYEASTVASAYFSSGMFGPAVSPYSHADHIFWLLSNSSSWLPDKLHSYLIEGMKRWSVWTWSRYENDIENKWSSCGTLFNKLYNATEGKIFKLTKRVKDDIFNRIELSVNRLQLSDTIENIYNRFLSYDFPKSFIAENIRRKKKK